jgi:DNA primase small subunit
LISENKSVEKNVALLKSAFREYYFRYAKGVENPGLLEQHEFGYAPFGSGMVRHLSYRSMGALIGTLVREVPADVYCSNAYYRFPNYPMNEKQWLGADLIFDIDAKDLQLPCLQSHSYFICERCKAVSTVKSNVCESCGGGTFSQTSIPCDKCVTALKKEVQHLLSILTDELGVDQKSVSVYFSGNNGFHLLVSDDKYRMLGPEARSDLVSYLTGANLMTETIGVRKGTADSGYDFLIKFPKSGLSYGWRRSMASKLGIDQSSVVKLNHIVQRAGGYESFKSELGRIAKTMGVRVDPQVTMDVHRIFRMPGTLNSRSGLVKMRCTDLKAFDPLNDSCLLGSRDVYVKVKVKSPQLVFRIKGELFKIREEILRLPLFAAVYLICKGVAEALD